MSPNFERQDLARFSNPPSSHALEQTVVVRKHRSRGPRLVTAPA
jgi:hypothetical protein